MATEPGSLVTREAGIQKNDGLTEREETRVTSVASSTADGILSDSKYSASGKYTDRASFRFWIEKRISP